MHTKKGQSPSDLNQKVRTAANKPKYAQRHAKRMARKANKLKKGLKVPRGTSRKLNATARNERKAARKSHEEHMKAVKRILLDSLEHRTRLKAPISLSF